MTARVTSGGLQPRGGIAGIAPYVGGSSALPGVAHPVKLSSNESPLGPSPAALTALRAAASGAGRYPDPHATALRAAIGRHHGLDPARIVCGAGSDELLHLLALAFLEPGDEAIHTAHGFLIYGIATRAAGGRPVPVPERDLCADVDAILAAQTPRTRIVFLANPNNPTGSYLQVAELRRLHGGLRGDVLLVLDAAYAEYVQRNDYEAGAALVAENGNVVMTRTFSKVYGLAGLRLGWCHGPAAVVDALHRIRPPFNVNGPAQAAGSAALADAAFTARAVAHNDIWRPWLEERLRALGLRVPSGAANFVLMGFPAAPDRSARACDAFLRERGIIVRTLEDYGLPDHLRVSVGLEDGNRAVVSALADFMGADGQGRTEGGHG